MHANKCEYVFSISDVSVQELLHLIFDAGSVQLEHARPIYINRKIETFEMFLVMQNTSKN